MESINTDTYVEKCRRQNLSSFYGSGHEKIYKNGVDGLYKHTKTYDRMGDVALMCPKCFGLSFHKFNFSYSSILSQNYTTDIPDTEFFSYKDDIDINPETVEVCPVVNYITEKCPHCNTDTKLIEVDAYIAEVVSLLNKKGYFTNFSCEGHNESTNPYISFSNKKQMEKYVHTIPTSWFVDTEDLKMNKFIIRTDFCQKQVAIYELLEWVKGLQQADPEDVKNTLKGRLFDKVAGDFLEVYNVDDFDEIKDVNVERMLTELGYYILGL